MKKIMAAFIVLASAAALAGCSKAPELKAQEQAVVAEYIAGEVLKYDKSYEGALIQPEKDEAAEETAEGEKDDTKKPAANETDDTKSGSKNEEDGKQNGDDSSNLEVKYKTIDEVFNLKQFTITYKKYMVTNQYPKNSESQYFTLISKKGRTYLVVEFNIKNKTNKKQKINLAGSALEYQLDINSGSSVYMPAATVLMNDINFLDLQIGAKKSKTAVLLFDIKEDEKMNEVNLFITKKANTAIIKLK